MIAPGERFEVVAVVAQRHEVRVRSLLARVDDVAREGRPAADDLVAWIEDRLAEVVDAAVCTRAGAHVLDRDAVPLRQRVMQCVGAAVRIPVQIGRRVGHRVERRGQRSERPFVRCELDDVLESVAPA